MYPMEIFRGVIFRGGDVDDEDVLDDIDMQKYNLKDWSEMQDSDGDGLPDECEGDSGTDIYNPDTDGDELTDGYEELYSSTNPLEQYTLGNGIIDSELDPDEDGLTMLREVRLETDPLNPDTDEDGLSDGEEANVHGTNPLEWDTDKDTIGDGDEIKVGLDPLNPQTYGYPDTACKYETEIEEGSEKLTGINTDNKDYQMSLEITAQGSVVSDLIVRESAYSDIIASDAILGILPEVMHSGDGSIESVTVKFTIDDSKIYETENANLKGINRYNIFMYYEEENILLPVKTTGDETTNTISATVDREGTFCVVDMEKWLNSLGYEIANAESIKSLSESSITELAYTEQSNIAKEKLKLER